jgi:hypothetical protein
VSERTLVPVAYKTGGASGGWLDGSEQGERHIVEALGLVIIFIEKNGFFTIKPGYFRKSSWFSLVLNLVWPPGGQKTIFGPAQRPRVGYRPEYFFPGGSIYDYHIAVEKQAPRNYIRSQNFARAEVVLNLVPILYVLEKYKGKNQLAATHLEKMGRFG